MVEIDNEKRIDWNVIRAEYIGGGISQRKLAAKHGVPWRTLQDRAKREGWIKQKNDTCAKAVSISCQKTAEAAADNAVIAADLKKRLLMRLSRIEQKYPFDATEIRTREGKNTVIFKIRDLTAAFRELTEDITGVSDNNELLQSLLDIERRAGL